MSNEKNDTLNKEIHRIKLELIEKTNEINYYINKKIENETIEIKSNTKREKSNEINKQRELIFKKVNE